MFEYANPGLLLLGGLSIVGVLLVMLIGAGKAQADGEKFKTFPLFLVMFFIATGIIVHEGYDSHARATNSYASYNNNRVIKCSSFTTTYLVSKDAGWTKYEDGFTKNDILVNIRSCRSGEDND